MEWRKYIAIALALILAGPESYSLDRVIGRKVPRWVAFPGLVLAGLGIGYGLQISTRPQALPEEVAGAELQAGQEAAHAL